MVWEFIKSCNGYESMNRVNAIKYVNRYESMNRVNAIKYVNDCKISKKPLIEKLITNGVIMHLFIIQCIFPKCRRHFNNQDEFKQHLMEVHNAGQNEVNNFEIYALMLIYNNNEKLHIESRNGIYIY
jgi:hypothetical protein